MSELDDLYQEGKELEAWKENELQQENEREEEVVTEWLENHPQREVPEQGE